MYLTATLTPEIKHPKMYVDLIQSHTGRVSPKTLGQTARLGADGLCAGLCPCATLLSGMTSAGFSVFTGRQDM